MAWGDTITEAVELVAERGLDDASTYREVVALAGIMNHVRAWCDAHDRSALPLHLKVPAVLRKWADWLENPALPMPTPLPEKPAEGVK